MQEMKKNNGLHTEENGFHSETFLRAFILELVCSKVSWPEHFDGSWKNLWLPDVNAGSPSCYMGIFKICKIPSKPL